MKKTYYRKGTIIIKITDFLKQGKTCDPVVDEVLICHPKQIINNISVPIWKVIYTYTTARGNWKQAVKYVIKDEHFWDGAENEFNNYMREQNEKYPERKLSNVKILDIYFLGYIELELE